MYKCFYKMLFLFSIGYLRSFASDLDEAIREEWKQYRNGSLEITEQIPGLSKTLEKLPSHGSIRTTGGSRLDEFYLVISTHYPIQLMPIINAHKPPLSHPLQYPLCEAFFGHGWEPYPGGNPRSVRIFSKEETRALRSLGIELNEVLKLNNIYPFSDNIIYPFVVKELRSQLYSCLVPADGTEYSPPTSYKYHVERHYYLMVEIPVIDQLRSFYNLPEIGLYRIKLFEQTLGETEWLQKEK